MTKGRRTKQQLGAEALTELKEGRVTPGRPEWSERRPLRFWQPFNDWWRSELDRLGRRPNAQEINCWYEVYAYGLWKVDAPSLQETRVHAKCLRSLPLVRDYFRNYRAKKRSGGERVGSNRQRRCSHTERKGSQQHDDDYVPGEECDYQDYGEEGEEGEMEGDEGEEEMDDDVSVGQNPEQHTDPDSCYPRGLGGEMDSYLTRDPVVAASAAAQLAQLASLRGGAAASAPADIPLQLLHSGVPALQSLLCPSAAAALWSSAAAAQQAAILDSGPPGELLRSFTLQQLQHAALHSHHQHHQQQQKQHLALAALAQNLAMTRAVAAVGVPGLPSPYPHTTSTTAALAQPLRSSPLLLVGGLRADERLALEEQLRAAGQMGLCGDDGDGAVAAAAACSGGSGDRMKRHHGAPAAAAAAASIEDLEFKQEMAVEEEEEEGPTGVRDFMKQVAQQAEQLGRGKRKRVPGLLGRRAEYELEDLPGLRDLPVECEEVEELEAQGAPSGRSSGGGAVGSRRGNVQQQQGRQRRRGRGAAGWNRAVGRVGSAARRHAPRAGSVFVGDGVGREDNEEEEAVAAGAMTLLPLGALQVPQALGFEPVSSEALLAFSREELIERVLLLQGVLQAHVQLMATQQPQLHNQQPYHHQRVETPPPPAPERRTLQLQLPTRHQQQQLQQICHRQQHRQQQQQQLLLQPPPAEREEQLMLMPIRMWQEVVRGKEAVGDFQLLPSGGGSPSAALSSGSPQGTYGSGDSGEQRTSERPHIAARSSDHPHSVRSPTQPHAVRSPPQSLPHLQPQQQPTGEAFAGEPDSGETTAVSVLTGIQSAVQGAPQGADTAAMLRVAPHAVLATGHEDTGWEDNLRQWATEVSGKESGQFYLRESKAVKEEEADGEAQRDAGQERTGNVVHEGSSWLLSAGEGAEGAAVGCGVRGRGPQQRMGCRDTEATLASLTSRSPEVTES